MPTSRQRSRRWRPRTAYLTPCSNILSDGLQQGCSHFGEQWSGFSVNNCPQGHAAPARVESEVPDGPAGATEGEGLIEKMANNIPPIPGWTVIGGNPAAKVAHFPSFARLLLSSQDTESGLRGGLRMRCGHYWKIQSTLTNLRASMGKYLKGRLRASQCLLCLKGKRRRKPTAMSSLTRFPKPKGMKHH